MVIITNLSYDELIKEYEKTLNENITSSDSKAKKVVHKVGSEDVHIVSATDIKDEEILEMISKDLIKKSFDFKINRA